MKKMKLKNGLILNYGDDLVNNLRKVLASTQEPHSFYEGIEEQEVTIDVINIEKAIPLLIQEFGTYFTNP